MVEHMDAGIDRLKRGRYPGPRAPRVGGEGQEGISQFVLGQGRIAARLRLHQKQRIPTPAAAYKGRVDLDLSTAVLKEAIHIGVRLEAEPVGACARGAQLGAP